ncbi:MAG: FtsX-like permease family protein [Vicinamibacterales bacterium]|nr:FtsX-like permease family protein [Vicinamibacterales bacterium]
MTLFRQFIVRALLGDRSRSAVTVVGMTLGVAVVVAIRLANTGSIRGFATALDVVAGQTSLEIVGSGVGVPETQLADLAWLRDYGRVSPVIDRTARVRAPDGTETAVRVLGVDVLRDRPFREYRLLRFTQEGRDLRPQEFLELMLDTSAVVLTEQFGKRHGIDLDTPVELIIGDRVHDAVVRGLLLDEGPARVVDGQLALLDIAAAQLLFDRLGWLDRVELQLFDADAVDPAVRSTRIDEAERAIAARLPEGLRVQRPAQRGRQVEQMLAAFHFNLTALSYIALVVGLFLVYNTVAVSVISRRSEIGTLRALGATRRLVRGLFLGEAAVLALVGAGLGLPVGWLLAWAAVGLTSTTVNTLYIATAATVPPLGAGDLVLACAVAVPLALAAAAIPANEAARMTPVAAVRDADRFAQLGRLPRRAAWLSLLLFGSGAWLARQDAVGGLPIFGLGAALAVVFGAAALVPVLLDLVRRLGRVPMGRWLRVEGLLAHANLSAAVSRLAVSVAALVVSLAMLTAIAIMVGSFRETVTYWVGQTLQADLFVATADRAPVGPPVTISAEAERLLASHPDVVALDGFRNVDLTYGPDSDLIILGAGDFEVLMEHGGLLFKNPADGRAAMRRAVAADAVVVSESFALKHDVAVDDQIDLDSPQGTRQFRVTAVYYDYSSDRGLVVMDHATFARYYGAQRPSGLSLYLEPGVDPEVVRDELLDVVGREHQLFIRTNGALRAEVLRIFDATFAITYALEAIAIVVAILGVATTLLTLILERRQELGMLRLVGAARGQIRRMVVIEAAMLGVLSQGVGLVVGVVLSLILIYVINVQSFGWTIQYHLPLGFLAQSTLLIAVTTALAGLYPARVATRATVGDSR